MKAKNISAAASGYRQLEDVVGCKWSVSVLQAVAEGISRPGALERHIAGISTKVLSERLRKLTHYGLWDWFPFGGFGDNHSDRNDIAAAALAAGRKHLNGTALRELVVIGDTPNDVRCARSIGARVVAVPTGSTSIDELRAAAPDVLVETLEDVEPILRLFEDGKP